MENPLDRLYDISFEPRPEYLYAFVKGKLAAPETRIKYWSEIIKRCRSDKRNRLMVVQDTADSTTPTDVFVASAGVVALGLSGIKISFVDLNPENYENNQFGETVAANRGAWAKVFTSEAEAHNWMTNASQ